MPTVTFPSAGLLSVPPKVAPVGKRLEALRACAVLDTPAEEAFDQLTRLAARLCGMPMAAIGFIDQGREWFKASTGIELQSLDAAHPLCALAVDGRVVQVQDTHAHSTLRRHPLVIAGPRVRAVACMPLITAEKWVLGAVVVMSTEPCVLQPPQLESLRAVAGQAIEIVADRGLARAVPPESWRTLVAHMGEAFRAERYEDGLTQALAEVSALLAEHFPTGLGEEGAVASGRNELPDAPVLAGDALLKE